MSKGMSSEAQMKELYYAQALFNRGGEPKEEFKKHPGINILCFWCLTKIRNS